MCQTIQENPRRLAEILVIRRITRFNQSINQSEKKILHFSYIKAHFNNNNL